MKKFFSPVIYGHRTSAALDALVASVHGDEVYDSQSFEASLLLSCSDVRNSAVHRFFKDFEWRLIEDMGLDVDYVRPFVSNWAHFEAMAKCFEEGNEVKAKDMLRKDMVSILTHSVSDCRDVVKGCVDSPVSAIAFSDTLFGPHIAKVLNALLLLEIKLSDERLPATYPIDHYRTLIPCRSFCSLGSQQGGTAFAGDLLLLQYSLSKEIDTMVTHLDQTWTAPVMEALFPEFAEDTNENDAQQALDAARREMDFVVRIVHGQALVVLTAGNRRLGEESPLGMIDAGLLAMVARLVIWG